MTGLALPKRGRVKLERDDYYELRQWVLRRDRWQCRRCSSRTNLQVHHITERSDLRLDTSANLCTLCAQCHGKVTRHEVLLFGDDANQLIIFRHARTP